MPFGLLLQPIEDLHVLTYLKIHFDSENSYLYNIDGVGLAVSKEFYRKKKKFLRFLFNLILVVMNEHHVWRHVHRVTCAAAVSRKDLTKDL